MKRIHLILLQCLVLLLVLSQSKETSAATKLSRKRLVRGLLYGSKIGKRKTKQDPLRNMKGPKNPGSKDPKVPGLMVKTTITSSPTISMSPTPVCTQYDDDYYYNMTQRPANSSSSAPRAISSNHSSPVKAPIRNSPQSQNLSVMSSKPSSTAPSLIDSSFPSAAPADTSQNLVSSYLTPVKAPIHKSPQSQNLTGSSYLTPVKAPVRKSQNMTSSKHPTFSPSIMSSKSSSAAPSHIDSSSTPSSTIILIQPYSILLPPFRLALTFNSSNATVETEYVSNVTTQFLEEKSFKHKYGSNFNGLHLKAEKVSQSNSTNDNIICAYEISGLASFVGIVPETSEVDALMRKSLQKKKLYSFFKKIDGRSSSVQNNLMNVTVEFKYYKSLGSPEDGRLTTNTTTTKSSNFNYIYGSVAGVLTAALFSITAFAVFIKWEDSRRPLEYYDATSRVYDNELQPGEPYSGEIMIGGKKKRRFLQNPSDGVSSMNESSRIDQASESNVSEFTFYKKPNDGPFSPPASECFSNTEFDYDMRPSESLISGPASEIWTEINEKDVSSRLENDSTVDVCLDATECFPSPMRCPPAVKQTSLSQATPDDSSWQFSLTSMHMRNSVSSSNSNIVTHTERENPNNNGPTAFTNVVAAAAAESLVNNSLGMVAKKIKQSMAGLLDNKNKMPRMLGLEDDASSLSGASIDDRFYFASETPNTNSPMAKVGGFMYV